MPIAGDLKLFETHARVVQSRLRPAPKLEHPTGTQIRAAHLVSASYDYLNQGADSTAEMLADRFGAHLDTELSTQKGVVVVKGDEVYLAFR
eukprot:3076138-Pleurochrysis_carterae.AAC.1